MKPSSIIAPSIFDDSIAIEALNLRAMKNLTRNRSLKSENDEEDKLQLKTIVYVNNGYLMILTQ